MLPQRFCSLLENVARLWYGLTSVMKRDCKIMTPGRIVVVDDCLPLLIPPSNLLLTAFSQLLFLHKGSSELLISIKVGC